LCELKRSDLPYRVTGNADITANELCHKKCNVVYGKKWTIIYKN
jgi:hypothetical protein